MVARPKKPKASEPEYDDLVARARAKLTELTGTHIDTRTIYGATITSGSSGGGMFPDRPSNIYEAIERFDREGNPRGVFRWGRMSDGRELGIREITKQEASDALRGHHLGPDYNQEIDPHRNRFTYTFLPGHPSYGTQYVYFPSSMKAYEIIDERMKKEQPVAVKTYSKKATKPSMAPGDIVGQDDVKELIRIAVKKDMPVLLIGDTGTGKTSIVKNIAGENDKSWIRFNLTGETTVDEFVGKYTLVGGETVWEDGILLQAMKKGQWLIVDEINVALPEILFVLHSLLDDDKFVTVANHLGEVVTPHEDFRFFATMNPVDEYAGTKELNKAFRSRFGMTINMRYPEQTVERKIIYGKTHIDEHTAALIVETGHAIRGLKQEEKIFFTCSTRDLIQWASLVGDIGITRAYEVTILNKADADRKALIQALQTVAPRYEESAPDPEEAKAAEVLDDISF